MLRTREVFFLWTLTACATPGGAVHESAADVERPATPVLEVRVDSRIEIVAVLARLAGFEEYQVRGVPAYDAAVASHFAPFHDHPSVATMQRLRAARGISHDALPALAILAEPGTWHLRVSPDQLVNALDARWDAQSAADFLQAVARFDSATGATAFFAAQDSIPRVMERQLVGGLRGWVDMGWFAEYFGLPTQARFIVVPGLQTGPLNYGLHVVLPNGTVEYYQVIGTPTPAANGDVRYPMREVRSLFIHEMSHPFVNPWVHAHAKELEPGASALFGVVQERMKTNAYGEWESMVDESVARAATLRYFVDHRDNVFVSANTRRDREQGFLWTTELALAMERADATRPQFRAAAPSIIAYFDSWREQPALRLRDMRARVQREAAARRAQGPQVIRLIPADGDTDVIAGPTVLELHFDRPMSRATKVIGNVPEVTGSPAWDDEKRVLRIPVRLTPGTTYRMYLNDPDIPSAGFASETGEFLYPRPWKFRVR